MNDQANQKWEKHWENGKHNLTWIGKRMLKAKQKPLKETLSDLKISNALDVGCGLGYMLSVFKNMDIEATGIDISPSAVKICKEKGLNAVQKKLEEVNEKYDLVFSDGLLEHFLNFEPYAKKLMEISNKYVCIVQTDHGNFLGKTLAYLTEILRGSNSVLEYNYRISDFISAFKKINFELIKIKGISCGIFKLLLFQKTE